jgi:hypothetical protein
MTAVLGLFKLIPSWLYAVAIAGLLATNCTTMHRLDAAKLDLSDLKAQYAEAARAAEASARAKEQAAATTLATIEQKARDEQKRLSADLAAAHRELRNRPERPGSGDVPKSPAGGVGCTGAGLFKPDAEFLVGHAARANKLRIDLAACQARYDAAVKLTNP